DRGLLALGGLGAAVVIAHRDRPARQRFHRIVFGGGIRRGNAAVAGDRLTDHRKRVVDLLAVVGAVIDREFEYRLSRSPASMMRWICWVGNTVSPSSV